MSKYSKHKPTPRKEIKYEKVDPVPASADEKEDLLPNESNENDNNAAIHDKKPNLSEIHSCKDLFQWMMYKPTTKLTFFYFFISIFIPPILAIYYFMDQDAAFIISGIFGITTSIYALNHFRTLLGLKNEIDNFSRLNLKFGTENAKLRTEVDRIESAKHELQDTHSKLIGINKKQRENNEAFRQIQKNMKAANLDSIEGIHDIRAKAGKLSEHWTVSLHTKERDVLFNVFERFEMKDDRDGMNKEEFDEFCEMVPDVYKDRFNRLGTFRKLAGNKSHIDYKDFEACLDLYHEMNVKDIDIDFKIECKKKPKQAKKSKLLALPSESAMIDDDGMPQFIRQVSVTKRSMPGVKFSPDDIEYDNSIIFSDEEYNEND